MNDYFVDLDDTLAEGVYPRPGIGKPIEGNIDKLEEVYKEGFKIFIYTARPWSDYWKVKDWCATHLPMIELEGIICGKPLGIIVDDRSVHPDGYSWL